MTEEQFSELITELTAIEQSVTTCDTTLERVALCGFLFLGVFLASLIFKD